MHGINNRQIIRDNKTLNNPCIGKHLIVRSRNGEK
jgi:hypothetical protein